MQRNVIPSQTGQEIVYTLNILDRIKLSFFRILSAALVFFFIIAGEEIDPLLKEYTQHVYLLYVGIFMLAFVLPSNLFVKKYIYNESAFTIERVGGFTQIVSWKDVLHKYIKAPYLFFGKIKFLILRTRYSSYRLPFWLIDHELIDKYSNVTPKKIDSFFAPEKIFPTREVVVNGEKIEEINTVRTGIAIFSLILVLSIMVIVGMFAD